MNGTEQLFCSVPFGPVLPKKSTIHTFAVFLQSKKCLERPRILMQLQLSETVSTRDLLTRPPRASREFYGTVRGTGMQWR